MSRGRHLVDWRGAPDPRYVGAVALHPHSPEVHRGNAPARTLLLSQRNLEPSVSRACIVEFEDLIRTLDRVDLVAPSEPIEHPQRYWDGLPLHKQLTKSVRRRDLPRIPERAYVDETYDLLMVVCEDISDLLRLGVIERWVKCARFTVCHVLELWRDHVETRADEIALLSHFDAVFLSCAGAVEPLAGAIGKPVHYLPPAVDTTLFSPSPAPVARTIDIYNMGRRSNVTHSALHDFARQQGWFYLYDTFTGNPVTDPHDHRRLLASLIKRSRYFVAFPAKHDQPELAADQEEVSTRYIEGAASGAILIGRPPRTPAFDQVFGHRDAVVPAGVGAATFNRVLAQLEADPRRVANIRKANIESCLMHHDWVHRWQRVLQVAGLPELAGIKARRRHLQTLRDSTKTTPNTPQPHRHSVAE